MLPPMPGGFMPCQSTANETSPTARPTVRGGHAASRGLIQAKRSPTTAPPMTALTSKLAVPSIEKDGVRDVAIA